LCGLSSRNLYDPAMLNRYDPAMLKRFGLTYYAIGRGRALAQS
jgi:hypothetical protein